MRGWFDPWWLRILKPVGIYAISAKAAYEKFRQLLICNSNSGAETEKWLGTRHAEHMLLINWLESRSHACKVVDMRSAVGWEALAANMMFHPNQ